MGSKADTVLKLSLAAAVLIAGSGVGWYYGVILPRQAAREEARETVEREAEQSRQKAAQRAEAEAKQRQESAQLEYQDCLNFAELAYKERWTASCHTQHDADVAAFEDCADNLFATQEGCRAKHPIRPERDCALPAQTAQSYSDARAQRKNECLARLQSAQGSGQSMQQMQALPLPQPMSQTVPLTRPTEFQ